MKKSGMTIAFVLVCIGVLVAAYGVGVCVREVRFYRARITNKVATQADKPAAESKPQETVAQTPPPAEGGPEGRPGFGAPGSEDGSGRQRMRGPGGMPGFPSREELQNMSEEDRQAAFAKMRERFGGGFGGRQREGGPQLSDEERAKMREEMDSIRERWDQMSDEEKQKVEADFREKYGYVRAPGARGGRGFGSGGSRQRSRPDNGQ